MAEPKLDSEFLLCLPMPPQSNHLYSTGRHGKRFKNKNHPFFHQMKEFEFKNSRLLKNIRSKLEKLSFFEVNRYFCFSYSSLYRKTDGMPKKMDVSNRIKAFDDELSRMLGIDDSLFWRGSEEKILSKGGEEWALVRIRKIHPRNQADLEKKMGIA